MIEKPRTYADPCTDPPAKGSTYGASRVSFPAHPIKCTRKTEASQLTTTEAGQDTDQTAALVGKPCERNLKDSSGQLQKVPTNA